MGQCVTELRRRIRSPAQEYKANHLLRARHRPVLEWLLGPAGPMCGRAHVHLVDKTFFLVSRVAELLVDASPDRSRALYSLDRATVPRASWAAFLAASNNLLRARNRHGPPGCVDAFLASVDALHTVEPGPAAEVLGRLRVARPRAEAVRAAFLGGPPPLDLLVPAIVATAVSWSGTGPISIVHDRQTALTDERIARIRALLGARLRDVRLADSRSDPRIQVADFLAGIARKVASSELDGRGDEELVALVQPYVDPSSVWGDDPIRSRLPEGAGGRQARGAQGGRN